jgi:hypothetical protein
MESRSREKCHGSALKTHPELAPVINYGGWGHDYLQSINDVLSRMTVVFRVTRLGARTLITESDYRPANPKHSCDARYVGWRTAAQN